MLNYLRTCRRVFCYGYSCTIDTSASCVGWFSKPWPVSGLSVFYSRSHGCAAVSPNDTCLMTIDVYTCKDIYICRCLHLQSQPVLWAVVVPEHPVSARLPHTLQMELCLGWWDHSFKVALSAPWLLPFARLSSVRHTLVESASQPCCGSLISRMNLLNFWLVSPNQQTANLK